MSQIQPKCKRTKGHVALRSHELYLWYLILISYIVCYFVLVEVIVLKSTFLMSLLL